MTITKLCSELAKREKTKSQAKIQAIRSIVGHLSDIVYQDGDNYKVDNVVAELYKNGKRRAKKGKRK